MFISMLVIISILQTEVLFTKNFISTMATEMGITRPSLFIDKRYKMW